MREKKTILEMMAELDAGDTEIYAAQTRIARREQKKVIEKSMADANIKR